MSSFIAAHQLEVRFTFILDFSQSIKKILSPISQMADNIGIEKEGTLHERITMGFDNEGYIISSMSDKLIFRYQGLDIKKLVDKNSPVESYFFSILEKLCSLETFGKITNFLSLATLVDTNDDSVEKNFSAFRQTFLNQNSNLPVFNDVAITLDNKMVGNEKSIVFGPYTGRQDLLKRNIEIYPSIRELSDQKGFMTEIKLFKISSKFSFSDYKEIINETINLKDNILKRNEIL